ncbi:hypothetical protein Tco_0246562 [Tanacetum coccineum]
MTRLHRAQIFVRPHTPQSTFTKALIAEYAFAPTPPSPPPSPLSPLSSPLPKIPSPPLLLPPLHTSPTYAHAPLGYRAAIKRLCLIALAFRFEVGESSTAAAGQTGHTLARRVDYGFIDTLDASIQDSEGRVMTGVEEISKRAWSRSEDRSTTLEALIRAQEARTTALEAHIRALKKDVSVLQRQWINDGDRLTMHIQHKHDRHRELERTRDAEHQDELADAGSSLARSVADAVAEHEANKNSRNEDDSHES